MYIYILFAVVVFTRVPKLGSRREEETERVRRLVGEQKEEKLARKKKIRVAGRRKRIVSLAARIIICIYTAFLTCENFYPLLSTRATKHRANGPKRPLKA